MEQYFHFLDQETKKETKTRKRKKRKSMDTYSDGAGAVCISLKRKANFHVPNKGIKM
jgi:hypothetical protein